MEDWELRPATDHGLPYPDRLHSALREDGLISASLHQAWWWLVRCQLSLWHRLAIRGRENLPRAFPFVLVANHASHLDAFVLTSALPWQLRSRTSPLAAGDVFFESPSASVFAAFILNALPVWRRKHAGRAFQELRKRLIDGPCGYVLFPEGTRSRDGAMGTFKSGVGMLVAGTAVPVVPCGLVGCHAALPTGRRIPRRHRIELHIGRPQHFNHVANDRNGWDAVARNLEESVRALTQPCQDDRRTRIGVDNQEC